MITAQDIENINVEDVESAAEALIQGASPVSPPEAIDILSQVSPLIPLSPLEGARFLVTDDPETEKLLLYHGGRVKEEVFGKRVVLFAPLYLSSLCHNNCLYCGFRKDNRSLKRIQLSPEEACGEARYLSRKGYSRLLLVCGESYKSGPVEYIGEIVRAIYEKTDIRILHLNAAPMREDELSELKGAGVGVFQVFQETYHRDTYRKMHPSGNKSNYSWRITCMDRAIRGGFDDVGIGALLGLYDWKFETLATVLHGRYLRRTYGAWPHTISVPRLKEAPGTPLSRTPFPLTDRDFLKVVALYRLCSPPSGVVVSTREPGELREESLKSGASQLSAGSRTTPGGYESGDTPEEEGQFFTDDKRGLSEMMEAILKRGLIPSLCTSCYRSGRTGETFTLHATSGDISDLCHANALLTLAEYSLTTDDRDIARKCDFLIEKEAHNVHESLRERFFKKLSRTREGGRDERF